MKKKKKEKMEEVVERIQRWTDQSLKLPDVLLDRVLKQGFLSIFILTIGIFTGFRMQTWNFVFWSVALSGFGIWKTARLIRIVRKGQYETVEGRVMKTEGKYRMGRLYRIQIQQEGGIETTLLLDKVNRFQVGKAYRFYFSKSRQVLSGIGRLDAALNMDTFYGFEELEEWDG